MTSSTRGDGNRIDQAILGKAAGLWPFLPAGTPTLAATEGILLELASLGVRGFEIGFPFSDPIADGPVIQRAFSESLARGLRVSEVFDSVRRVRDRIDQPILGMASASIVYRIGVESFVAQSAAAGFDGLIVPDLSLEEAPSLKSLLSAAGLRLPMLVAPTSDGARRRLIAETATGFLYYVSIQGTTGARSVLPEALSSQVASLRHETGQPVIVGFGVSRPEQVRSVCGFADGAIVGSAIVRRMLEAGERGLSEREIVRDLAGFVCELMAR